MSGLEVVGSGLEEAGGSGLGRTSSSSAYVRLSSCDTRVADFRGWVFNLLGFRGLCAATGALVGMFGGGSSGTLGAVSVTFLSGFCLVSFFCVRGEELDELAELVTVSPELLSGHLTRR